ncbi:hypothetical protein C8F04DRAFT_1389080 [Mycena alexandri]|uniref:F-box domain-containing protein n=1 Tax=Mycena alexandri TaxID=1745969 RepID=A0AAD6TDZ1_9AGAR|nr:hypothetical protein C8F04DRAFT_1389080 [Mycena alexandri]
MSFSLLANELVLLIISYIPPSGIEDFALLNTKCHALSLPALDAHLKHKHHAAAMHARFPSDYPLNRRTHKDLIEKGLLEKGTIPNLEYLHLNGDLHWLRAQSRSDPRDRCRARWLAKRKCRESRGKRLGLTLPAGFATFIGTQDLIERLYLGGSRIHLGDLLKCTPEQDGGKGGYVVRFLCDQQGCGYWGLYMDSAGHSCVVRTEDWSDFLCGCCEPYAYPPGVHEAIAEAYAKLRFICVKAEWEEWMAGMYFDGWIGGTLWAGREVVGWEMEYLRHFEKRKDTASGEHEEADSSP